MAVRLVPLSDAVAPARALHRRRIAEVRRAGLATGRVHATDAVALVLAAVGEGRRGPEQLTHWTRPSVNRFLKCDLPNWCSMHRCLMPDGIPEVLWDLLEVLCSNDQLDPASDALVHLREPLICYGGLGFDGNPRPPTESPIPCACYWPVGDEEPDPHWDEVSGQRVF